MTGNDSDARSLIDMDFEDYLLARSQDLVPHIHRIVFGTINRAYEDNKDEICRCISELPRHPAERGAIDIPSPSDLPESMPDLWRMHSAFGLLSNFMMVAMSMHEIALKNIMFEKGMEEMGRKSAGMITEDLDDDITDFDFEVFCLGCIADLSSDHLNKFLESVDTDLINKIIAASYRTHFLRDPMGASNN